MVEIIVSVVLDMHWHILTYAIALEYLNRLHKKKAGAEQELANIKRVILLKSDELLLEISNTELEELNK